MNCSSRDIKSVIHDLCVMIGLLLASWIAQAGANSADYTILHDTLSTGGGQSKSASYEFVSSVSGIGERPQSFNGPLVSSIGYIGQINRPPVIDPSTFNFQEDQEWVFLLQGTDLDSDPLTYVVAQPPSNGTLIGTPPNLQYRPNLNFNGSDLIRVKVSDGLEESKVASITFNIQAVNDAPLALGQNVSTAEDTLLDILLVAQDVDLDPLTFEITSGPTHGLLRGQAPSVTYTPNSNYNGPDSFSFKALDGALESLEATVVIQVTPVNDAPVILPNIIQVQEDQPRGFVLEASDVDLDVLTFDYVTSPLHGTLSGTPPILTFEPENNYHGSDAFQVKVSDGLAESETVTITFNIQAVNDAPVAQDARISMLFFDETVIPRLGSDLDGDNVRVVIQDQPQHGRLVERGTEWVYENTSNAADQDQFTFHLTDENLFSQTRTVTLDFTNASFQMQSEVNFLQENGTGTQLTITRSTHLKQALTFDLSATPGSWLTLPLSLTVPAGATSAEVAFSAINDDIVVGDREVEIRATHRAFNDQTVTLIVSDDDLPTLSVSANTTSISENGGSTTIQVLLNTLPLEVALVIAVATSPDSQLIAPSQVTIPAGSTETAFNVTAINNQISDGNRDVMLTFSANPSFQADLVVGIVDDDVSNSGRLSDGLIADATVFFDPNFNQILNEAEPWVKTDTRGRFLLNLPVTSYDFNDDGVVDLSDGQLVGIGGTDISTGILQTVPFLAPPSATVITPLTTLVVGLTQATPPVNLQEAVQLVRSGLNIDAGIDLLQFDMFKEAANGNPQALSVIKATSQLQDTLVQISGLLSGAANRDPGQVFPIVQHILLKKIADQEELPFQDAEWIAELIDESGQALGLTVSPDTQQSAAFVIATSNQKKQEVSGNPDEIQKSVLDIARVQAYSQSQGQASLKKLGANTLDAEEVALRHHPSGFDQLIGGTAVGLIDDVDLRSGSFSFGQPRYEYSENGTAAIAVNITRTLGNFGAVQLTLTPSGDSAEAQTDFVIDPVLVSFKSFEINKTISLENVIIDDDLVEELETFLLTLAVSDDSGALIGERGATQIELIDNDNPGSFQFSTPVLNVSEKQAGPFDVFIQRTGGSSGEVRFSLNVIETEFGARIHSDYSLKNLEVVFPDGVFTRRLSLSVIPDSAIEPDEGFQIELRLNPESATQALIGPNKTLDVLILNDDVDLPPVVHLPDDLESNEDQQIGPLNFTVEDDRTLSSELEVTLETDRPELLPADQIQLGILNDAQNRTLTANPVANGFGDVVITFHVSDGLQVTSGSFKISILQENDIPVIAGISELSLIEGDSLEIDFEVTDVETPADELQIFATGFHDVLPVNGMFEISGAGTQRKLRITRQAGLTGNVILQLIVVDGSGLGFEYSYLLWFGDEPPDEPPTLNIELTEAGKVRLIWEGDTKLYKTTDLNVPFELVLEAVSPHTIDLENMGYFILR